MGSLLYKVRTRNVTTVSARGLKRNERGGEYAYDRNPPNRHDHLQPNDSHEYPKEKEITFTYFCVRARFIGGSSLSAILTTVMMMMTMRMMRMMMCRAVVLRAPDSGQNFLETAAALPRNSYIFFLYCSSCSIWSNWSKFADRRLRRLPTRPRLFIASVFQRPTDELSSQQPIVIRSSFLLS